MFSYISLCKICHPRAVPFWLQGQHFNKLGRGHIKTLGIVVSDKNIFMFSLYKTCDPRSKAILGPSVII